MKQRRKRKHYDDRKQQIYDILKIPYKTNFSNSSIKNAAMIQTVVVVVVIVIVIYITIFPIIDGSIGASARSVMTRCTTMIRLTLWRHIC